jgi:hypothetical protein
MAAFGWTNDAQWACPPSPANHLNLPSVNQSTATQAVTPVVERAPFSELIETAERIELIPIRELNRRQE